MQDYYHWKIMWKKSPDIFQATCNIYKACLITLRYYEYLLVPVDQKEICTEMSQRDMIKAFDGLDFFYQLVSFRTTRTSAESWYQVKQGDSKITSYKVV